MKVSLLVTCVVDVFEPEVGEATVRVLRRRGCEVTLNLAQTCCGQPAWNAGFATEAAVVAATTLSALEHDLAAGADAVVVPAGSCAAMVKMFWPELFEVVGDRGAAARARAVAANTYELGMFLDHLTDGEPEMPHTAASTAAPDRTTAIAYHRSCHLLRELHAGDTGERLLRWAGCELVAWDEADRCCGFGGTFSAKLPDASVAMADDKLASLAATGADVVVSGDSSCLMHLRSRAEAVGTPIVARHLAEVLDGQESGDR